MSTSAIENDCLSGGIEQMTVLQDLLVEVQYVAATQNCEPPPNGEFLQHVAQLAYAHARPNTSKSSFGKELTIRIVDELEMQGLNKLYRGKDKSTNVLSFEFEQDFEPHPQAEISLLGDIVLCHSVIVSEALAQLKPLEDHYAHMVAHGVLHLLGFDHQHEEQAVMMESTEAVILAECGVANPYQPQNTD